MEISKKDIIFELVNTENNLDKLQNCPHREVGDLSVIYKFLVSKNDTNRMTLPITNEIAEKIEASEEELFEVAYNNTKEITPFKILSMREMLMGNMFPDGISEDDPMLDMLLPPDDIGMYVLSNEGGLKGACGILYSDLLGEFADKFEADLIIIPSSIHEVIILPDIDLFNDKDMIRSMVSEINEGVVAEEDRLSNNIYLFDRENREIKPIFDDVPSISDSDSLTKNNTI